MVLTIATILTVAGAASLGSGVTILVQKIRGSHRDEEDIALQHLNLLMKQRQLERMEHLNEVTGSTTQETSRLSADTTAHTTKIALNLGALAEGVSQIDRETHKLIVTNSTLVSTHESHDELVQTLAYELKNKISQLSQALMEIESANKALLAKEREIVAIRQELDRAKQEITQHEKNFFTIQEEHETKNKAINLLKQEVASTSQKMNENEQQLRQASLTIESLQRCKAKLLAEARSSHLLIDRLTHQLEQAQECSRKLAPTSRFFSAS